MEKQLFKSEIGFKKGEKGEEDKIGINIETKVNDEFKRQTQGICNEINKIGTTFNADRSFFEQYAKAFGTIANGFLKVGLLMQLMSNWVETR
ncbi:hypothetical protein ID0090_03360 [Helicobacter pylori]